MDSPIYSPLEEYESKFRNLHAEKTLAFFENLEKHSGINAEENRKTVEQYNAYKENLSKLTKKCNLKRFLRVLMCITIVLIPVVITKTTPAIRALREEIETADKKADELLALAEAQMAPLNSLFSDNDALVITEETVPLLSFAPCFSADRENDMRINYDFIHDEDDVDESAIDVLSGDYNGNPFLFENKIVHRMGTETYYGYKTISWTESYRDSSGKLQRRTKTQTLQAAVEKPKPYYSTQVVLNYGSQGGSELSFSREATALEGKSEKAIDRYVRRGEKKLKRLNDKAIKENEDFQSMSNSDFEVLFNALDRTDEVQYRALFTPLAQTNMVDLILSETSFCDDFSFIKKNRMNKIISEHSQGRTLKISPEEYRSYSYDIIRENFLGKNTEFFRAVYFDFAPLLAIPAYQERPVHSLKPIPEYSGLYALKECETLANAIDPEKVAHPDSKTTAILKSRFVATSDNVDETCITAFSYDIEDREDVVAVFGGDGRYHNVYVPWKEYIPLQMQNNFYITKCEENTESDVMAVKNGLCIYK